jgi:hypothetical protein
VEFRTGITGFTEKIDNFENTYPVFDPRSGEHLWVVVGMWKCDPEKMTTGGTAILDHENLLNVSVPGCYHCEEPYSPRLAIRRCKGD